jgi:TatD DNase family protein
MTFIDTHAHLTAREFDADRDDVLARAADAGIRFIVNPGTNLDDSRRAVELADRCPMVYAAVGYHPHDARLADDDGLAAIEELSKHPRVVAIGEIGLDFHYDLSPRDAQERAFAAQLAIAQRRDLPVIIHTRESLERTIGMLSGSIAACPSWRESHRPAGSRIPGARGVFHCYPGDVPTAWQLVGMGFLISLPGIVTFKKPGHAVDVAGAISIEHQMLETDSPYLSPVPYRGTRNEPSRIPLIAERIAETQHLSVEDIARSTNVAAFRLFGIGEKPEPRFTYPLKRSLYINLTNRCDADCVFCDRKGEAMVKGHNLKITREPEADEVIAEIGDPTRYDEVVFCGYGEPTIRLEVLKQVARRVKELGGRTRLNTDGHGNMINKRNIVPELAGLIDAVSVSLNSTDPEQYGALMRIDGPRNFAAMVEFAREAVRLLPRVTLTIVDLHDVDEERARTFVEKEIGAVFATRPFF